ncbi:MAG TPA: C40 family peptidase [Segeticoccus sp.]|uniref:C40 family peptidase n=1 Tax=Segeticoccus sp. TaxID=2706531 RepID=UPI002D8050DD|nr:C40 family peptidase [Segeticoccus sp.]HET8601631.1 C40 family peptidase [Segeticoccus sp.]
MPTFRHLLRVSRVQVLLAFLLVLGLSEALSVALAKPAHAYASVVSRATSYTAVRIAASKRGAPYRWGADGPYRFDCSGLTTYVYRKRLHKWIPRTAQQQYNATRHINRRYRRPGDLVFFKNSRGHVYHVAIYAGSGRIWEAVRPGIPLRKDRIWSNHITYGRVHA